MTRFDDIRLLRISYLRGPNLWTYRPVLEAWLDLGELEDWPSNKLPGFNERLTALLPALIEHHCGVGERGGFLQRLQEGTWAGHVLEHVVIELLNLAGMPTGFGQTRSTSRRGVYRMVFRARDVEGLVVDGRHEQPVALRQRLARDLLVAGAEHHAVHATLRGAARLAETGGHAGQVQQLDHDMLQHMAGPGAFGQALDEAAALADAAVVLDQCRQQRGQPVVEAGQLVRGPVLELAEVQPDLQHGAVGPEVGAAQVIDAQQLDVVLLAHERTRGPEARAVQSAKGRLCARVTAGLGRLG